MSLMKCLVFVMAGMLLISAAQAQPVNPKWPQKWNYVKASLYDDEGLAKLTALLKQSKDAGCTHIALGEAGMTRLPKLADPQYQERVRKIQALAKELNLQIVPLVFSLGYGGSTLGYDPNLLCGLPVQNVLFIVKGQTAAPDPAAVPAVANAGFEDFTDKTFAAWGDQKWPGVTTFVDTEIKHSGKASLRIGNLVNNGVKGANGGMVTQKVAVQPFQYYRLSAWLRVDGFAVNNGVLGVSARGGKQNLNYWNFGLPKSAYDKKEWTKFTVMINTLDNNEITLEFGAKWGGRTGSLWMDDIEFVPAGFLNIIRRDTAPLTVTSADGKTTYVEGKDFKPVADPAIAEFATTGEMDITHPVPALELTGDSSIKDGQKLLVSYYQATQIDADQHVVTMQDPKVLEIWDQVMKQLVQIWPAPGYFMAGYDEIRMGGWEPQPKGEKLTPAQILARHTTAAHDIIKKYAPNATVYTWSDMYTPGHNASNRDGGNYWLANGTYYGSWESIPRDMVMMQWYAPKPEDMQFFAKMGYHQVICGYYDERTSAGVRKNLEHWFEVSAGVPNVDGMMYTTWGNRFTFLKEFFELVDGYPNWPPLPTAATGK